MLDSGKLFKSEKCKSLLVSEHVQLLPKTNKDLAGLEGTGGKTRKECRFT